jgi:hypothetical protein
MLVRFCILALIFLSLCISCTGKLEYENAIRTIDSLGGALNSISKQLKDVDSAFLERSLLKFRQYNQFIGQNVTDTLSRAEADDLQRFMTGGSVLDKFKKNRETLLARAGLMSKQLKRLVEDVRKRALPSAIALHYTENEKRSVSSFISLSTEQLKIFHQCGEDLKRSIRGVEQLIRKRNKGELPVIITDTPSI